jgi:L-asparaginase II
MIQALPLVESGAADGLGTEQLALACASHSGGAMHVERVARWLADQPAVNCSRHLPMRS